MSNKKLTITLLIFISSTLIFIYFLNRNMTSYFDEIGYHKISQDILKHGLFGVSLDLRTYLYPLLIAVVSIFTDGRIETIKIIVSILQFSIFLFTIFSIGKVSERLFSSDKFYYVVIIFGALNPYLVQSTAMMLTDILASCFLILSFLLLFESDLNKYKNSLIMSILLYSAVMIRPSSAIFLPIFLIIAVYRYFRFKDFKLPKFIVSGILSLVIFFPQIYNNVHNFNDFTPLIHVKLLQEQNNWAAEYLKYSTVTEKNEKAKLFYYSPFKYTDKSATLTSLIFSHPLQFIVVYSAHVFGLFDWGFVDTFIKNLKDKSKLVFSILLFACWVVMVWGIIRAFKIKNNLVVPAVFATSIYILFMGTTGVESRFGYPVYLFLLPFVGLGFEQIISRLRTKRVRNVMYVFSLFTIILLVAFFISLLIDKQTGRTNWF